nr:hypothetical protein JVH1_1090 [Rhodococcus sp. JVH1]
MASTLSMEMTGMRAPSGGNYVQRRDDRPWLDLAPTETQPV